MTAPATGYYFAEVTDNQGRVAVTAPIWLGSDLKVGITSVANSSVMPVTTEPLKVTTTFFNNELSTATNTMKVADINKVLYVGLDASHGNEYVSGGAYPNSMANMMTLVANNSLRVLQLNNSQDFIKACNNPKVKMMILKAPSRKTVPAWLTPTNYTADEIAALKAFSDER